MKRRTLVIAAITVALSIGIVFASIPYLPHSIAPHGTIRAPVSRTVIGGNRTHPGFASLYLAGVSNNESFAVAVTVVGGSADFCAIADPAYQNWVSSYFATSDPGGTFPSSSCVPQEEVGIVQSVISWSPTGSGTWDVAALNTSPQNVTVTFSPA